MRVHVLRLNYPRWIKVFFLLCIGLCVKAQQITITDLEGNPLEGVWVYDEGQEFSQFSDDQGIVTLPNIDQDNLVHFQYLSFETLILRSEEIRNLNFKIQLRPEGISLDEVVVVGRTDLRQNEIPFDVQTINRKKLELTQSQTSADALGQHSNVFIQKSQMGGGSPILRGFEANKVLLVVDGVRLNNAIYRNGHLQNAITVDQGVMDRTEVIFGPGSLAYGSDALGGVVHFRTRTPELKLDKDHDPSVNYNLWSRYASANQEKSFHLDLNWGTERIAQLFSVSTSFFEDLRTGSNRNSNYPEFGKRIDYVESIDGEDRLVINSDPNVQEGTAYRQFDFLHKVLFQLDDSWQITSNIQFSTSSDIPRYDQLIERSDDGNLRFAEWYYGPQTRALGSLNLKWYPENWFCDKMIFIPSYQFIEEDRIDRRFQSDQRGIQNEDLHVLGVTVDFQKEIRLSSLSYGVDAQYNDVRSIAFEEDIHSLTRTPSLTRYPNANADMFILGTYAQLSRNWWKEKIRLSTGIRFSQSRTSLKYLDEGLIQWPLSFFEGLNNTNQAITGSVGLNVNHAGFETRFLLASAFRAANIDDLAKIRIKNSEILIPNLDLNPERSNTVEISIGKHWKNKLRLGVTGFYTQILDAFVRQNYALPDGQEFIIDEGDTLVTIANVNAQKGRIFGLSANANYSLSSSLKVSGSINYTKGRSTIENVEQPLSHIPPLYGRFACEYENESYLASFRWIFNGAKKVEDYGDSSDNLDLATEDGTPAWQTFNLYTNWKYKAFKFGFVVENILDSHYRPFSSGLSGPGRNFILSLKWSGSR